MNDILTYKINGRYYTFCQLSYEDDGMIRGYCKKKRKWAWLSERYIQFDGAPIQVAERVEM